MMAYTVRRLLQLIPVLFGMSIIVFSIVRFIPGDPARTILGTKATEEAIQHLRTSLGLDQTYFVQYVKYLGDVITGDLGTSIRTGSPISDEIWTALAATAELTVIAMIIAVVIGLNAGIISAWFQNSWFDYLSMVLVLIGISIPVFWLGLMLQWQFAVEWGWLPSIGRENIRNPIDPITHLFLVDTLIHGNFNQLWTAARHLLLPAVTLGTIPMAIIARMTRSSMLDVMRSDYIRTARAKGQKMFWIVYRHALKNAFIPVLTVIGFECGFLLGGAVLTETIFGWPGIGRYVYDAILARDYPVVQSGILVMALIFIMINLVVDLLYAAFDPRIKYK
ncbi:ABC transporter permease [Virgibacillus siamensis]|uniref:ABC transporter permease n=1 Tax=Virgibacillus siamensis TaxID=480071 RepID=UPI000985AD38|nr:ABC transporter permease [Virgibacillus siamensis]